MSKHISKAASNHASVRCPAHRSRAGRLAYEIAAALLIAPALVYAAVRALSHNDGFVALADHEVAVVEDGWSGARRIVARPGWVFFLPWLQSVERLDRSPQALVMEGGERAGPERVPLLLLRARDGSSFWFESFRIQYVLNADVASQVLEDTGADGALRRELVEAHARAILRDEFGRYSPEEVARPDVRQAVARTALEHLNAALAPHAILVLELSTPKPDFDEAYEDQINRRKIADQEVLHLVAKLDQLEQEKAQRETAVKKDKEIELKKLAGDLIHDIGAARRAQMRTHEDADIAFRERSEAGRAIRVEKEEQARVLTAQHIAFARRLSRETREIERWGDLAVRTALIDKLAGIEFTLVPYNRDSAPQRVEYETAPAPVPPKATTPSAASKTKGPLP